MKVNIQTNQRHRFTIPVPYSFLYVLSSLLSSKFFWRQMNKWLHHHVKNTAFSITPVDASVVKRFLGTVIAELKHQKGLVLVDVKLKDGTYVKILL